MNVEQRRAEYKMLRTLYIEELDNHVAFGRGFLSTHGGFGDGDTTVYEQKAAEKTWLPNVP